MPRQTPAYPPPFFRHPLEAKYLAKLPIENYLAAAAGVMRAEALNKAATTSNIRAQAREIACANQVGQVGI
jgi:hypothetical protein